MEGRSNPNSSYSEYNATDLANLDNDDEFVEKTPQISQSHFTSHSQNETRGQSKFNLLEGARKEGKLSLIFENIKKYHSTLTIKIRKFGENDIDVSGRNVKDVKSSAGSYGLFHTVKKTIETHTYRSFYSLQKISIDLTEVVSNDTISGNSAEPDRPIIVTTKETNKIITNTLNLNTLNKTQEESNKSTIATGNNQHTDEESHIITTMQVQDPIINENGIDV
uniref:Uncharacterized protein n=1 Tax=Glossina brevipalpis TaxID=37001 RepID=A0A1A9WUW8_9MUSC